MTKKLLFGFALGGATLACFAQEDSGAALRKCIAEKTASVPQGGFGSSPFVDCMTNMKPVQASDLGAAIQKQLDASPTPEPRQPRRAASTRRSRQSAPAATAYTAVRKVSDSDVEQVKKGMALAELRTLLGKPYSQITGDTVQMTYLLESGKRAKIEAGSEGVIGVQVVD